MGITFDLAQLVLDNETAGLIKRAVNGIEVNDTTLSLDTIKEIGPFKDYLAHPTTFENMRVTSSPKLMDRRMRPQWEKAGGKDAYERANEEVKRLLETHKPAELSESTLKEVKEIVAGAEEEMGVRSNSQV